ncbi:MAG: cadherin-like domain-containing protein, partial [Pseudomonadota bacterium]
LTDNGDGTYTYTPNAGFSGSDSFTYTISDGTDADTATVNLTVNATTPPSDLISDDFAGGTLADDWTFLGIAGSAALGASATDGYLSISSPAGVPVSASDFLTTPRVLQAAEDEDFQISAGFLTEPNQTFQEHGLLVVQDDSNFIRFDIASTSNSVLRLIVGVVDNGDTDFELFQSIPSGSVTDFRITRSGDNWTFETSNDGVTWSTALVLDHALQVSQVGVFAGSAPKDGVTPGYTAQVDYFENAADPITDEDGTIAPVNAAPDAVDDGLSTDEDVAVVIDVAGDLLANDSDADGDSFSLTGVTQPANGTLSDNGNGTYTYTPNAGFSGSDSFTYTISDGTDTDTATVNVSVNGLTPPSELISDDFASNVLDAAWSIEGPSGIATSLATNATDAYLELVTPDGNYDVWNTNNGVRAVQDVADGDFQIETRFLTTPTEKFQLQGLLVEQDASNWLRFDTYSDGNNLYAFAGITVDGDSSQAFRVTIPGGTAPYLRVDRSGDNWTFEYSLDGDNWVTAGSFSHALSVTKAGVFAGNTGNATGYTAQVDYFENTAAPIADEDGTYTPVNLAPDAADDGLVTPVNTALAIAITADLLANDSDPNGDVLSLTDITQPANGTLSDNGNGTYTYTPNADFSGTDTFTYTVSDGEFTDTATVTVAVGNPIDVWYGLNQSFGGPGEGQTAINILGNVAGTIETLTYSLNGGPEQMLLVGADTARLQNNGDFNVEIDFSELDGTSSDDVVTITATLAGGVVVTRDVVVQYQAGPVWDTNYNIDWSTVTDAQDVLQIVDGTWSWDENGIRPVDLGYDRLLVLGDQNWDNYELNMAITMHDINVDDPVGVAEAFAIGLLWGGHTQEPSDTQLNTGYEPGASFTYTHLFKNTSYHKFSELVGVQSYDLQEGLTYNFTVRVEQTGIYDRLYSLKVWEEGTAEPVDWTLQSLETFSLDEAPATGGIYLNAHYYDVTFGDLTVTEITGNDIIQGDDSAEILVAADTSSATPGLGEIDVFVGAGGADVFVFGDANGSFYDDGIGADAGEDDYGFVYDFVSGTDQVQLAGVAADYVLSIDAPGLSPGTAIWRVGENGDADELIGILNSVYGLDLNGDDFVFTDTLLV